MVKGISRQVIVVRPQEEKLFEQAIFILKDNVPEITDEALLREANVFFSEGGMQRRSVRFAVLWSIVGAAVMAVIWLVTTLA